MRIDPNIPTIARLWKVVNADTGAEIRHAVWIDEDAGQCGFYRLSPTGSIETDDSGAPVTEAKDMNVMLEWIGPPNTPMQMRRMK